MSVMFDAADRQRVARRLREARERRTRTQEHVAGEAGVSVKTVKRAEAGDAVSAETLRALCAVLDLDVEDIWVEDRPPAEVAVFLRVGHEEERTRQRKRAAQQATAGGLGLMIAATAALMIPVIRIEMARMELVGDGLIGANNAPRPNLSDTPLTPYGDSGWVFLAATILIVFLAEAIPFLRGRAVRTGAQRPVWSTVTCVVAGVAFAAGGALVNGPLAAVAWSLTVALTMTGLTAMEWALARRGERGLAAAQDTFAARMPGVLARMRVLIDGAPQPDRFDRALALLREAQALADAVGRSEDVASLEMLLEDLSRGISGRKGLLDYVSIAERICGREPLSGRFAEDAGMALNDLRRRVNAFA